MEQVRLEGVYGRRLARALRPGCTCRRWMIPAMSSPTLRWTQTHLHRVQRDISGRMIGAEAFLSSCFAREAVTLQRLLQSAPAYQKPDGHFGAVQHLPALQRSTDMPILWGNGRLLIDWWRLMRPPVIRTRWPPPESWRTILSQPTRSVAERRICKAWAGGTPMRLRRAISPALKGSSRWPRLPANRQYRKEAERIAELALAETAFDDLHSHGRLTTVRGVLALYELTGDARWLQGVERDWKTVVERYLLPTGGITEMFSRSNGRDEGCAVSDWLRLTCCFGA